MNEKAKSYAVGFFNGDVKIFNATHQEILSVSQLHDDSRINDLLYFNSDKLDSKLLVTCSELPNPSLTISKVAKDKKTL